METNKIQILYIGIDHSESKFLFGTEMGYGLIDLHNLNITHDNLSLGGGIGLIELLPSESDDAYVCVIGGGAMPYYPLNVLTVLNANTNQAISEIRCGSEIQSVKTKKHMLAIITESSTKLVSTINLETLHIISDISSIENFSGIGDLNKNANNLEKQETVVVTYSKIDDFCGEDPGAYAILTLYKFVETQSQHKNALQNYEWKSKSNLAIQDQNLKDIDIVCLNSLGNLLAVCYSQGQFIKLFDTRSRTLLKHFKRGSFGIIPYELSFDSKDQYLS